MVGGGDPFYLKYRVNWSEIADFEPIFAHSVSAVTPTETKLRNLETLWQTFFTEVQF